MFDGKAFGEQMLTAVKGYVGKVLVGITERIDSLERRISDIPAGKDGTDGEDGRDGTHGKDGVDGKSVTLDDVRPLISEAVAKLPTPKDGRDGENGKDGKDGRDGIDGKSVALEDVRPLIQEAVKSIPLPKDGKDGRDGSNGKDGIDGKSVTREDLRPMFEAELAKAMLEHERRATDLIQRCIDRIEKPKDGIDGKDGRDAFQLGDIQLSMGEDERTLMLAFVRGDERIERSIVLTHPIYRGVWRSGTFAKGDSVTYGGSSWIATRETNSKPETDDSWRLSVKRGRDGKDGLKGDPGTKGRDGRDLTAMGARF